MLSLSSPLSTSGARGTVHPWKQALLARSLRPNWKCHWCWEVILVICSPFNVHNSLSTRAHWEIWFKACLFSSTFWSEHSFGCHLVLLVFCPYSSKNGSKNTIFQKWLKIHPKVLNAKNKHGIHHFRGWLALQVISVFLFQRPKCHFLALENGNFWQKCAFSSAKKWHFGRWNKKTETTFKYQHPPKMVDYMFVLSI